MIRIDCHYIMEWFLLILMFNLNYLHDEKNRNIIIDNACINSMPK